MESEKKPNKPHHENGQKEPLDPAKIAPNLQILKDSRVDDYTYSSLNGSSL